MKKIKVIYRKLGKERADGQALSKILEPTPTAIKNRKIELDERLRSRRLFAALFHETLHHALPSTHENEIERIENEMIPTIWNEMKKHPERYK